MTDRAAVIDEEQQAVDYAYACLDKGAQRRGNPRPQWNVTDAKAGTSFIPDTAPEVLADVDDLGGAPLVIKRIDVLEPGSPEAATESETFYIGRRLVRTPQGDPFVINWNARAAKEWMLARHDRPGHVRLRRDLRCDGRKVTGYFDDITPSGGTPRDRTAEGSREWLDLEDFLLDDLRRARGDEMRDIVETIQREQFILVSDDRDGLLVVQGGPGTGKTAVGLHRTSWLLANEVFKADDVLVIGPHRGFLRYVGQVLPRLGTRGVASVELSSMWEGEVRGTDEPMARQIKSGHVMAEVLRRAVDNLVNWQALEVESARGLRSEDLPSRVVIPLEFVRRCAEADDHGMAYAVRRRRFTDHLVDHLLHVRARGVRERYSDPELRGRLERSPQVAELVSRVFPRLSAEQLLRSLLRGQAALQAATADLLTEKQRLALVRPPVAKISEEPWSAEDLVCLSEIRYLMTGAPSRRYKHLVIDEAQDLTPMQARSLSRLSSSGSMTVLGDLAQSTGVHRYGRWEELAGHLGAQGRGHLAELTIGYRVPREVMDFAAPLARQNSPGTVFPRSVRPPAEENPVSVVTAPRPALIDEAIERVQALPGTDGKRARSVALIVPNEPELLRAAREQVAVKDLGSAVHVLTAPETKGLEFDHVVVLEPTAIADQIPTGPYHLYVALTRCTQTLTLVHADPLPRVLVGDSDTHVAAMGVPAQDLPSSASPAPAADDAEKKGLLSAADGLRVRLEVEAAQERSSGLHEYLRFTLVAELFRAGRNPQYGSALVDIAWEHPSGRFVYEILGEGGHSYTRMREGAARMSDIEYMQGETASRRFLVLPEAPADDWAAEALSERHDVSVIWHTATGWAGQSVSEALGSG